MERSTNPYQALPEGELVKLYTSVSPNITQITNRFNQLFSNVMWSNAAIKPEELQALKAELDDYLEELIKYQIGLGAAITAVNNENHELCSYLK